MFGMNKKKVFVNYLYFVLLIGDNIWFWFLLIIFLFNYCVVIWDSIVLLFYL